MGPSITPPCCAKVDRRSGRAGKVPQIQGSELRLSVFLTDGARGESAVAHCSWVAAPRCSWLWRGQRRSLQANPPHRRTSS